MLSSRLQQLRCAQQATDMVGTERWARHIAHRNLPRSCCFAVHNESRRADSNPPYTLERNVVVEVVDRGAAAGRGGGGAGFVAEPAGGVTFIVAAFDRRGGGARGGG